MNNKIDITQDVCDYFALMNLAEGYDSIGNKEKAGEFSLKQTRMHSKIASNIYFFKENQETARKVISEFFKKAAPFSDYFGKNRIYDDNNYKLDYNKINFRSHCFIYNNIENNIVKVTVESSTENINAKVEFSYENGILSDVEGEPVKMSIPLDTFRKETEDPSSIPFNKIAERLILRHNLVPAYWTSGYAHATSWFCDGISKEEAKRLLAKTTNGHDGGKYQYIMYDSITEEISKDFSTMLKEIINLF